MRRDARSVLRTAMREGPSLSIAGTVYGSGREVDDCNGLRSTSADPIVVEVTDATGRVISLTRTPCRSLRPWSATRVASDA